MKKMIKLIGNPREITLGCDPEFEECQLKGEYKPIKTTYHSHCNKIGGDGGTQLELRPEAHSTPMELIKDLRALVKKCPPISTKGDKFSLGGHIHIGGLTSIVEGQKVPKELLEVLDAFIGIPTSWANGKARGEFAKLGQVELKPHGFEYRSPSSAWMDNPKIATLTFQFIREIISRACSKAGFEYEVYENLPSCPKDEGVPKITGLATVKSYLPLHYGKTEKDIKEWMGFFREKKMKPTCNENW